MSVRKTKKKTRYYGGHGLLEEGTSIEPRMRTRSPS